MNPTEGVAVVSGLLCVWLVTRQSIWCWPVGLIQVSLYVWIFYEAKLYSDVLLHVVFIVLQVYGWQHWVRNGRSDKPLPVIRLNRSGAIFSIAVGTAGTAVLGLCMRHFTDASLPFWDAGIAAFSLVAQCLLARKYLENWFVWIGVDVVAIGVYTSKQLYLTAGLYAVFLALCFVGLVEWRRTLAVLPRG
jgi:nicotinamide mononucleotide transporter